MTTAGFIGAGQMARALASGFVSAGKITANKVQAFDPSAKAIAAFQSTISGAASSAGPNELVAGCDVVFLAVKPQHMGHVFNSLDAHAGKLFVSIAAGVTLSSLEGGLKTDRVIRVMPNTPCLVGAGASGYSRGTGASQEDAQLVGDLLSAVGIAFELPEALLDAVTGLSGSGPAFVYQFIEALSDGGVLSGLPRTVATQLAAQTVLGAAKMVLETAEHPGLLKDRVASPAGTTIAGLAALERGGLRGTVIDAVKAASDRSRELGSGQ